LEYFKYPLFILSPSNMLHDEKFSKTVISFRILRKLEFLLERNEPNLHSPNKI
jgi:hypothetical protein